MITADTARELARANQPKVDMDAFKESCKHEIAEKASVGQFRCSIELERMPDAAERAAIIEALEAHGYTVSVPLFPPMNGAITVTIKWFSDEQ